MKEENKMCECGKSIEECNQLKKDMPKIFRTCSLSTDQQKVLEKALLSPLPGLFYKKKSD